jgi:hypothetical protein
MGHKNFMTKSDLTLTHSEFLERARFYNIVGDRRRAILWLSSAARFRAIYSANLRLIRGDR